jgi:hypothetical protein
MGDERGQMPHLPLGQTMPVLFHGCGQIQSNSGTVITQQTEKDG